MSTQLLKIHSKAPELSVKTVSANTWDILESKTDKMTMVVFYRGLHCPVCKSYLEELNNYIDDFKSIGVNDIIAISVNSEELAQDTKKKWDIDKVEIGYNLSIEKAREWGLYISDAIKDTEPYQFNEPGLFLVDSDKKIFYAGINSMPFGRPVIPDMYKAAKFIFEKDYPSRGRL